MFGPENHSSMAWFGQRCQYKCWLRLPYLHQNFSNNSPWLFIFQQSDGNRLSISNEHRFLRKTFNRKFSILENLRFWLNDLISTWFWFEPVVHKYNLASNHYTNSWDPFSVRRCLILLRNFGYPILQHWTIRLSVICRLWSEIFSLKKGLSDTVTHS